MPSRRVRESAACFPSATSFLAVHEPLLTLLTLSSEGERSLAGLQSLDADQVAMTVIMTMSAMLALSRVFCRTVIACSCRYSKSHVTQSELHD